LAELYDVSTKVLKQAVRRNIERFPDDFMFELTRDEIKLLNNNKRSQIVTFNWPSITYTPFAFTQGVAMLSTVLRSSRAVKVNIEIMRTFVILRKTAYEHAEIRRKLTSLEEKYDDQFNEVFSALKLLLEPSFKPRKQIGDLKEANNSNRQ
jgi:hypothetical protein